MALQPCLTAMWGGFSNTITNTQGRYSAGKAVEMKLKDKKIELLRQVHTRDEIGITKTILESMGTV